MDFLNRIKDILFPSYVKTTYNKQIEHEYFVAGIEFANLMFHNYSGETPSFEFLFNKWNELEKQYSDLGFKTLSLYQFNASFPEIRSYLNKSRKTSEIIVLHASDLRNQCSLKEYLNEFFATKYEDLNNDFIKIG